LETRNLKFEKVLFLDANEGIIPDTTREDSFLPFKARQILGLPTYLDREEIMFYTFDTLIRGSKDHICFTSKIMRRRGAGLLRGSFGRSKRKRGRGRRKAMLRPSCTLST